MGEEFTLQVLNEVGAVLEGHFLLSSGRHAGTYLQCARLFQYPDKAASVCTELAKGFSGREIGAVIGPATGAIILAYEVARSLGVRALFAERESGRMSLRRGFDLRREEPVLVVEDVITTGGSVAEVLDLVREAGGRPVGVGCIVNRSSGRVDLGVSVTELLTLDFPSFEARECPLCHQGLPLVKPGSR